MSGKRKRIVEIAEDRQTGVCRRVNSGNGHDDGSGLLSWYFARPRADGLTYVLTAKGYVILPTGLPRSRRGVDTNEVMEQNYQ